MSLSLDKGTSLEESRGVPAPPKINVLAPFNPFQNLE